MFLVQDDARGGGRVTRYAEAELDTLSEAGARSLTRARDAADSSVYEVRHTDPASYLDDLAADVNIGAVVDSFVRLAIVSSPATMQQITPDEFIPSGGRLNPWFRSKFVVSSYQARGQLVKLSAYCGIAFVGKHAPSPFALEATKKCALALQETMRRVHVPLMKLGLDIRGGGVYVEDPNDPWLGNFMSTIELPPVVVCLHCDKEIYFANEAWRHRDTKRAMATRPSTSATGRPVQVFDHDAAPREDVAA